MYINLSFIENFFRVEDWRDRWLWHQSFNSFLRFINIPVWLEKSFKAVFKSLHNVCGLYRPWAFSWLRFSLFLHLHQRWGVGSASATLREIHRVIISQALWLLFDPPGNDTSSGPSAKLFFPLWTWPRRRGSSCRKPFRNGLCAGGDSEEVLGGLVKEDLKSRNVCSWCLWWWFHLFAFFYIPGSNSNDFRAVVVMRNVLKSQHNISVFKSTQWRDQKIHQCRDWDFFRQSFFLVFASLDRKMRWPDRDSGRVPFLLSGGPEEPVTYW